MSFILLIPEYFFWHYTTALRLHLNIVSNFLWFTYHYFSVPVLVKTLFLPWRKSFVGYRVGFRPKIIAETLVVNSIMRIVGFFIRFIILTFATAILCVVALVGLATFLVWLALPAIIIILMYRGSMLILS